MQVYNSPPSALPPCSWITTSRWANNAPVLTNAARVLIPGCVGWLYRTHRRCCTQKQRAARAAAHAFGRAAHHRVCGRVDACHERVAVLVRVDKVLDAALAVHLLESRRWRAHGSPDVRKQKHCRECSPPSHERQRHLQSMTTGDHLHRSERSGRVSTLTHCWTHLCQHHFFQLLTRVNTTIQEVLTHLVRQHHFQCVNTTFRRC